MVALHAYELGVGRALGTLFFSVTLASPPFTVEGPSRVNFLPFWLTVSATDCGLDESEDLSSEPHAASAQAAARAVPASR